MQPGLDQVQPKRRRLPSVLWSYGSQGRRGAKRWLPVWAPELTTSKFTVGSEPLTSCELGFSATHRAEAHQNGACDCMGPLGVVDRITVFLSSFL